MVSASEGAIGALSSATSTSSLLVSVLRSTVPQSDLPFLENIRDRIFPLPKASSSASSQLYIVKQGTDSDQEPNINNSENEKAYENICEIFAENLKNKVNIDLENLTDPTERLVKLKMIDLCPEVAQIYGLRQANTDLPSGNIRVRHVQPMLAGKHAVCRNTLASEPEPQLRRSAASQRKVVFEQTSRMFQAHAKGSVVYDVMDPKVADNSVLEEGTLRFESRFESGNLQLAVKCSNYEYDLIIQSDVNSVRGKHNQWFYFSVKGAQPNVTYKFNILNLSKPGSQFNNGMQPVVYSMSDPVWKRAGDSVFYLKNHFSRSETSARPADGGDSTTKEASNILNDNTYASLIFTMTFKNSDETYYIAYHYPYTYSELQRFLHRLYRLPSFALKCKRASLCQTLGGNDCPLLTITDFDPGIFSLMFQSHTKLAHYRVENTCF